MVSFFLKNTSKTLYLPKKRQITSKFKQPKRAKVNINADKDYGNADALDIIKDVKDAEFIIEMNQFVR